MTKKASNPNTSLKIPRIIISSGKFFSFFSSKLVTLYVAKIFITPIKHKIPKRELEMVKNSSQKSILISSINKEVIVYEYGQSERKILLVHGWSGRGTQLVKIADDLIKNGYSIISFDAPAHGKSPGKSAIMTDFIEAILEINKLYGPFEVAIGHSLGGMSVLNAIKKGFSVNQAVIIGSGDVVQDIIDDFIKKLELKPTIGTILRVYLEKKYNEDMNNYSVHLAAAETNIPILVVHDKNDPEVNVKSGINIHKHLKNGELLITEGLGHRKILGNQVVIEKINSFIEQ